MELPLAVEKVAATRRSDAIVALGNMTELFPLPKVERVLGGTESQFTTGDPAEAMQAPLSSIIGLSTHMGGANVGLQLY